MENRFVIPPFWGRISLVLVLFTLAVPTHAQKNKPAADLEQFRNGSSTSPEDPGIWTTGNNGSSNSHYAEGWSAPYRVVMTNLDQNSNIALTLEYDVQHSGKLAIDYLTSYDRLQPHLATFGHNQEEINPTFGTTLFQSPPESPGGLEAFKLPPVSNSPAAGQPANSFDNVAGAGQAEMAIWNGTINSINYIGVVPNLLDPSNQSQQFEVIFTTGSDPSGTVILAWGGHIASRNDWGFDENGDPMSAGGISGSPYHMRLKSWNLGNLGNKDLSLSIESVSAADPPTVPDNYLVIPVSIEQIDHSWDPVASSNAIHYVLEFSTTSADGPWTLLDANLVNTTFSHISLNSNTTYYYQLKAVNIDGESGYVTTSATTPPDLPLSASNLTGQAISDIEIQLDWADNSVNETGFRIERSVGDNTNYVALATLAADITTYNDTGLSGGVLYFYRVVAFSADGDAVSASNEISQQTKPSAPVALDASDITISSFTANWDASTGADSYKLDVATDDQFNNFIAGFQDIAVNGTSSAVNGLISNTAYFYRVRAVNLAGTSGNSNIINALTSLDLPPAPDNFIGGGESTSSIILSWDEVTTSSKLITYTLGRSSDGNDPWTEIATGLPQATINFTDQGLQEFTIYFYRLKSINNDGSSEYVNTQASTLSPITTVFNQNGKSRNNLELTIQALESGLVEGNPFDLYTISENGEDVLIEIIPVPSERENVITELITTFGRVDSDFILGSSAIYIAESKNIIDVFFPITRILELKDDPRIKIARIAYKPHLGNNGLGETGVISQGDIAQTSDKVRESFRTKRMNEETGELEVVPIDGTGVSVTVISDSWDQLPVSPGNPSRWERDQLNSDLSGPLNTLRPDFGIVVDLVGGGSDEGRAMGQIIHDVAPGALLSFRTGFKSYNSFINEINQASISGEQIICEDLTYPQAPMFEEVGPLFEVITNHIDRKFGNAYVHSSGNFKNNAVQAIFDPIPLPETSDMYPSGIQGYAHQWALGDIFQELTINPGADFIFVLQWLDAGGWASHGDLGAEVDLDMFITNGEARVEAGNNVISFDKDPLEVMIITTDIPRVANLMITCEGCTDPVPFRVIALKTSGPNGGLIFNEPWNAPTIAGPGLSDKTITVGASFYWDYGVMENFSTFSGLLPNGKTPQITITGPDGANNTAIGVDTERDPDIFPEFFGTSAAAPHVAGVMALFLQALPSYFENGLPPGILSDATYATGNPADEALGLLLQTAGPVDNPLQGGSGTTQAEVALKLIAAQTPEIISFESEEGKTISAEPVLVTFTGQFFVPGSKILLNGEELPTTFISETELQAVVPPFSGGAPNSLAVSSTPSITPSGFDGGAGPAIDLLSGQIAVNVQVSTKILEFGQDYSYSDSDLIVSGLAEGETLASLGFPEVVITLTAQVTYPDIGFYTANADFAEPLPPELSDLYVVTFKPGVLSFTSKDLLFQAPDFTATYGDPLNVNPNYIYDPTEISDNDGFLAKIQSEHQATYFQDANGIVVLNRFSAVVNENPLLAQELIDLIENSNWMATETSITNRFSPVVNDFNILEFDAEQLIDYLVEPTIGEINPTQNRFSAVVNGSDLVTGLTQLFDPVENRFSPVVNRFSAVVNRFSAVVNIPLGDEDDNTDYTRNLAIVDALDASPEGSDPDDLPSINVFSIDVVTGKDVTETIDDRHYYALGAPLSPFFTNFNITMEAGRVTINPLPITVDLDDGEEVTFEIDYGDLQPSFTSVVDPLPLPYQEEVSISYNLDPAPASTDPVSAGNYLVLQGVSMANPDGDDRTNNYDIVTIDGSLDVNPGTLTITTEDALITAGEDIPSNLNTQISGFIPGQDELSVFPDGLFFSYSSPEYEMIGREAGTYLLLTTVAPDPSNYTVVDNTAQLMVNLANGQKVNIFLDCVAENKGNAEYPFEAFFSYSNKNSVSVFAVSEVTCTDCDVSQVPTEWLPGDYQFSIPFDGLTMGLKLTTFEIQNPTSISVDGNDVTGNKCKGKGIPNGRTAGTESVEDLSSFNSEDVQFYPNPVNDRLVVRVNENFSSNDFELYDSQGIRHDVNVLIDATQSTVEFDFTNFDAGLYLLKLNIDGTTALIRILRQ